MVSHFVLTSQPWNRAAQHQPIEWGAPDARSCGPLIASLSQPAQHHAIGTHPAWNDPHRIVSLAPWGHRVTEDYGHLIATELEVARGRGLHE